MTQCNGDAVTRRRGDAVTPCYRLRWHGCLVQVYRLPSAAPSCIVARSNHCIAVLYQILCRQPGGWWAPVALGAYPSPTVAERRIARWRANAPMFEYTYVAVPCARVGRRVAVAAWCAALNGARRSVPPVRIDRPCSPALLQRCRTVRAFRAACLEQARVTGDPQYLLREWQLPWYLCT